MPFVLISGKETWTDFFLATEDGKTDIDLGTIQNVKTFIYIKVKLIFDPPSNAAMKQRLKKLSIDFIRKKEDSNYGFFRIKRTLSPRH